MGSWGIFFDGSVYTGANAFSLGKIKMFTASFFVWEIHVKE